MPLAHNGSNEGSSPFGLIYTLFIALNIILKEDYEAVRYSGGGGYPPKSYKVFWSSQRLKRTC